MRTVKTTHSWGSRLGDSIKGVLLGLVLFVASFVLLWWNEGRAVEDYRNIAEVRNKAVPISSSTVSPEHEGKAIHLTARAETDAILTDPVFEVSAEALRFRRSVEMYQWREISKSRTRKKVGGGTEKTTEYSYERTWSGDVIRSGRFQEPADHQNPTEMPYQDWQTHADHVGLGAFTMSRQLIRGLRFFEPLHIDRAALPDGAQIVGDKIFIGDSPDNPAVGDIRITFSIVPEDTVSVVAAQNGSKLVPWTTSTGAQYFRIQRGTHTLEAMMVTARKEAQLLAWILRGLGWLLMAVGIGLVLRPLAVVGDVVPFAGNLVGGGIVLVAGLLSAGLSLITISIAWIAVRPMVGVPLLIVAGVLFFLQWKKVRADNALAASAGT